MFVLVEARSWWRDHDPQRSSHGRSSATICLGGPPRPFQGTGHLDVHEARYSGACARAARALGNRRAAVSAASATTSICLVSGLRQATGCRCGIQGAWSFRPARSDKTSPREGISGTEPGKPPPVPAGPGVGAEPPEGTTRSPACDPAQPRDLGRRGRCWCQLLDDPGPCRRSSTWDRGGVQAGLVEGYGRRHGLGRSDGSRGLERLPARSGRQAWSRFGREERRPVPRPGHGFFFSGHRSPGGRPRVRGAIRRSRLAPQAANRAVPRPPCARRRSVGMQLVLRASAHAPGSTASAGRGHSAAALRARCHRHAKGHEPESPSAVASARSCSSRAMRQGGRSYIALPAGAASSLVRSACPAQMLRPRGT